MQKARGGNKWRQSNLQLIGIQLAPQEIDVFPLSMGRRQTSNIALSLSISKGPIHSFANNNGKLVLLGK